LYSAQFEDGRFILLVESDDVIVTAPQKPPDVVGGAVAEANPNEFRRRTSQKGKSVKILVLADHQAPVLTRQVPDDGIRRPALPEYSNVQGPRKNVGYRFAQLLRQWLIEEEPRHFTQPAS
jgi:hypothetical protein